MLLPVSRSAVLNAVIMILAVIAGILGYFVYEKYAPVDAAHDPARAGSAINAAQSPAVDVGEYGAMSDTELVLALPNSSEASPETLQAYSTEADRRAVETDRVTIGAACAASPAIAAVAMGDTVVFANEDSRLHTLQLTPDKAVAVPAHDSKSVTIDFVTGTGMYGYPCDDYMVLAGMLVVR